MDFDVFILDITSYKSINSSGVYQFCVYKWIGNIIKFLLPYRHDLEVVYKMCLYLHVYISIQAF